MASQAMSIEQELLFKTIVSYTKANFHTKAARNANDFFLMVSETLKEDYEIERSTSYVIEQYRKLKKMAIQKYGKEADVEWHLNKLADMEKKSNAARDAAQSQATEGKDTEMGEAGDAENQGPQQDNAAAGFFGSLAFRPAK